MDQEVLELQQLLEGTAVLKAEVDGLLSSCMLELTDLLVRPSVGVLVC